MSTEIQKIQEPETIEQALAKFNPIEAAIQDMRDKFMPLTIESLEDKARYKEVEEARKFVKSKRVEVGKTKQHYSNGKFIQLSGR